MSNVPAAEVKRLREQTGAGILDCKKALEAADGDFTAAVEALRIKGVKDAGKRADRTAANGLVTTVLDGTDAGLMFELNCETDFVAKTERFQRLAADIATAASAGKPADRLALLSAEVRPGSTVQQLIDEAGVSLKEKLELGRFARFEGGYVASYLHRSDTSLPPTLGVLIQLDADGTGAADVARDIAQQIAAMRPQYVRRDEVPADVVESERRIAEQITRDEGKPEQIIPKIVDGRVNRFYGEVVLTEQTFVKDPKKTIKQVLAERIFRRNGVGCRELPGHDARQMPAILAGAQKNIVGDDIELRLGVVLRGAEPPATDDEADPLAGEAHVIEHGREITSGLGEAPLLLDHEFRDGLFFSCAHASLPAA